MATKLFAEIKKSSKYHHQAQWAKDNPMWGGYPFPVTIAPDPCGYVVQGGPGGQYRLADVTLYAEVSGGAFLKIEE